MMKKIDTFNVTVATKVHVFKFPSAKKLNPLLHKMITQQAVHEDKGALMTPWGCQCIPEFRAIADYGCENVEVSQKRSWHSCFS